MMGQNLAMRQTFSDEAWDRYLGREELVSNRRFRPDGESFLDALASVDMTATPERREAMEMIRNLN